MAITEITFEHKLRSLYDLQFIHTQLDKIRNTRGDLPLEVEDLESYIFGYEKKFSKFKNEIESLNQEIKIKNEIIIHSKSLIIKYKKQLDNIRNAREHNVLTKEIEYQELEIELAEKRINEYTEKINELKHKINETLERLEQYKKHLIHKKNELTELIKETEEGEEFLKKKAKDFSLFIDKRLLTSYERIRSNSKNGLAVVSIERGAAVGSYFTIPPQKIVEISLRKKIITDEHSGKILVDEILAREETEKMKELLNSR